MKKNLSSQLSISHLPGESMATLRVYFFSSGKWRQSLSGPSEYPMKWQKITGASNSASITEAEFHLYFISFFWASMLGFMWWKGSTTGTLLTFLIRQGLAHLHLVPTGSVNDPRLSRQTTGQQGAPQEFLGWEGEGSLCTKSCQHNWAQSSRQKKCNLPASSHPEPSEKVH